MGNYLTGGVVPVSTISPLPPNLPAAPLIQHDRPARILKDKPTNKVHRAPSLKRSKSPHTTKNSPHPKANLPTTSTNIVSPPPPLPTAILHSSLSNIFPATSPRMVSYSPHPLSFSDSSIPSVTNPTFIGVSQDSTKFKNIQSPKKHRAESKRKTMHATTNSNTPNIIQFNNNGALHTSTTLNQTTEIYPTTTTTTTTSTTESSSQAIPSGLLHEHVSMDNKPKMISPKQEHEFGNPFLNNYGNSFNSSVNTTFNNNNDTTVTAANGNSANNNGFNNNNNLSSTTNTTSSNTNNANTTNTGLANNNNKKAHSNYPNNFSPLATNMAYYNYLNAMQHMYMPHPLMYCEPIAIHDPSVRVIDNSAPNAEDPPSYPQANPSNDLYSCLYNFNNNNNSNPNNNNNTSAYNTYSRSTTPPANNASYNIYNYSNLYNNMYEYPNYTSTNARAYNPAYMGAYGYLEAQPEGAKYNEKADYTSKGHRSKRSKSSKRNLDSDDEDERRKSRKSKSRSHSNLSDHSNHSKHSKHKSNSSHHSSHSSHSRHHHHHPHESEDDELPDYDIQQFSSPSKAGSNPPSPYLVATKQKKANLFENTPKIKIGESSGAKTKISKLGKKLLQVVGLDWRVAPFVSLHSHSLIFYEYYLF